MLASLSGSGSSFFGLFDDARRARRAHAALASQGFAVLRVPARSPWTSTAEHGRGAWTRATRSG